MNRQEKERLSRLEARVAFLDERIESITKRGGLPSFDIAERSALRWAIDVVCDAMRIDQQHPAYLAEVAQAKRRGRKHRQHRR